MCHEAGCSLAHIPYQFASCGCIHAGWMARATAAEAENAALREALTSIKLHSHDVRGECSGCEHVQEIAVAALQETTDVG